MSYAVFGKTITRKFTADDGSQYLTLPSQTPTIYIFDSAPSYADAIAGTGAIETISSWTQSPNSAEITYTVTAIDDPDPAGALIEREYWECILYKLTAAEQTQSKIRMFTIHRADVLESTPGTSSSDVLEVWPGATQYITAPQLADFIPQAEAEMRLQMGVTKWARLSRLTDAKMIVAYKAIEMMAASQVIKGNADKFTWMVDYFKDKYTQNLSKLDFPIDIDGDGKPDEIQQASQAVVFSAR